MSLPTYANCISSNVNWLQDIPSHWRTAPFRTLFLREKRTGYTDEELLSVYRDYGVIPKASRSDNHNNASADLSNYQLVEPGDLAINKMKAWQGSVGISEHRGIVSPAYFVYRSRHSENSRFLHYLLRSGPYVAAYLSYSKGIRVGQWDLDPQAHGSCPVLLPTRHEQTAIADFLDRETAKIDVLIEEQERLISLLQEKRQAVISHAVTKGLDPNAPMKPSGIDWLGDIPAHWDITQLNKVVDRFVDYRGVTPTKVDEGVPLITATQIKKGRIDHSLDPVFITEKDYAARMTRGWPKRGDLILTTEAPLGEVALVEDERIAPGQRMILMKCNPAKMLTTYLLRHFQSGFGQSELQTRASGSTASGIRSDRLRASQVLIPPVAEQSLIADHIDKALEDFEPIQQRIEKLVALLKERRAALISAAVTGKIDVRGLAARSETQAEEVAA